jgi:Holliday junction resolvasome RuvABC endonuclease subunit
LNNIPIDLNKIDPNKIPLRIIRPALILAVDPGPEKSGYAIIEMISNNNWTIQSSGVLSWDDLLPLLSYSFYGVAVEEAIMYSFPGKSPNNKQVAKTIFQVGRLYQKAMDFQLYFHQMPRIDIIKEIVGKRPGPGFKVTKADMQKYMMKILNLDKPIKPQHVNDAMCAAVVLFKHPNLHINWKKDASKTKKKSKSISK